MEKDCTKCENRLKAVVDECKQCELFYTVEEPYTDKELIELFAECKDIFRDRNYSIPSNKIIVRDLTPSDIGLTEYNWTRPNCRPIGRDGYQWVYHKIAEKTIVILTGVYFDIHKPQLTDELIIYNGTNRVGKVDLRFLKAVALRKGDDRYGYALMKIKWLKPALRFEDYCNLIIEKVSDTEVGDGTEYLGIKGHVIEQKGGTLGY